MDLLFPSLSEEALSAIVGDINSTGFGVAKNAFNREALAELQSQIEKTVAQGGSEYVVFTGREAIENPSLRNLSSSGEFVRACQRIYEIGTGAMAPASPFYQVLRCLAGNSGEKHSFIFHYDSYVLTALVPIIIPTQGQSGDLLMLPNSRPLRRSYSRNLVDKILLDNKLSQYLLRRLIGSGRLRPTRVRMTPGDVYFFWGSRSIHANEPCGPDKIRATALFHYVDPHADSSLRKMLGRA